MGSLGSSHLVLLAPHFVPSNLTSVHRARLWAQHLHEFGYRTTVLTTHWRHYEEAIDWSLMATLPKSLAVVRTSALPTRPLRVVGDVGIRSLPWYQRALTDIHRKSPVDFVHITIPSGFASLLGRFVHDRLGVAYGIDYIDPWVHDTVANGKRFSKAWASNQLARWLEPWALKHVRLLTGVAEGYFADVLARMPQLEQQAVTAAMGYGIAFEDFAHARKIDTKQLLFRRDDGYRHLVYAGALLPHGHAVVEQLFAALARLRWLRADLFAKLKVHFIGVGHDKVDDPQARLNELIKRFKLHEVVQVIPRRMQYLRVLRHLTEADACLVLGGEKSYYTPSKVYQALASGVPVLGVLHTASEAWRILGACPNACAVGYAGVNEPLCGQILIQLVRILESAHRRHSVSETSPHIFTARDSARRLAAALDKARSSALPLGVPTVAGSYG